MGQFDHLYNTTRWRRQRAEQLRQHPLCKFCDEEGKATAARIADHVHPHRGDEHKFWNGQLQSLCKFCHDSLKQQREKRGFHSAIGNDGWPLDPKHPVNLPGAKVNKEVNKSMAWVGGRQKFGANPS